VTGEHISILAQLPSLTELTAPIVAAAAPQLPLLTQLKKLDFFSGYEQTSDPFLPFIPRLHQLTELSLSQCSLSDEQGVRIMSGCKHLTSLVLDCVRLESLGWLSSAESIRSGVMLTALELWYCDGVDPSDMISILSLKSLQQLSLYRTCRLDDFARHSLTPPSALLPNLTLFDYEHDDPEE